jgi:hypothetical protein
MTPGRTTQPATSGTSGVSGMQGTGADRKDRYAYALRAHSAFPTLSEGGAYVRLHCIVAASLGCWLPIALVAQTDTVPTYRIYGFVMTDAGYNFKQINPNWFDVVRPTKLPAFENQFGTNGNTFYGVRQTRFGVEATIPSPLGEITARFEWELFGTGVDTGQTTLRLRHAYGQLGHFGAGQTWSPFMDPDVFPNSLEYWGPNGMVFFRNIQVRWMPILGDTTRAAIAIERPGASADQGVYAGRIELQDVTPRFPLPDLSAEYRQAMPFGYVELAGLVRRIKWEDQGTDQFDLTGSTWGWGVNLSSNFRVTEQDLIKAQVVYGEGIENYMNDAPADVGIENNFGNAIAPVKGVPIPILGVVAFLDHSWSTKVTSSVGYSLVNMYNPDATAPNAFRRGQYALGNLLFMPTPEITAGAEFQWGDRANESDGFSVPIYKLQFSFRYAFSKTF